MLTLCLLVFSEAALCTKGRYISSREKVSNGNDRPLYICIQAVDKQAIDEAIHQIKQFIEEHTNGPSPALPILNHPAPQPQPPIPVVLVKDKVYVRIVLKLCFCVYWLLIIKLIKIYIYVFRSILIKHLKLLE